MEIQSFPLPGKPNAPTKSFFGASLKTHLDWALAYAYCGWHVFSLHSIRDGRCTCGQDCGKNAGKHPRVKGGFKAATIDARQIEAWWRKWPDANIGIATSPGSSSLMSTVRKELRRCEPSSPSMELCLEPQS
jgi:hypothetical protein